ncbi:alpha/beta hydrolase [Nonomuraea roseola]|uniref:alpha/beta hydrolase n=1 Tax=Nonomuraea roseola TaxID=46179 RepID=UPI0031F748C1
MIKAALAVLAVAAVLLALVWIFQRRLIYLPDPAPPPAAGAVLPGARDVAFTTSDGLRLTAWHLTGGGRGVTVLVAGGNAGNRLHRGPLASALRREGFDVLLMDYRGYGGNPGSPSEEGLLRDARAARALVKGPVIYFGESLGAAVVTALATEDPPDALVLRSPLHRPRRGRPPQLPVPAGGPPAVGPLPRRGTAGVRAGADRRRVRLPRHDRPGRAEPYGGGLGGGPRDRGGGRGRGAQRQGPSRRARADRRRGVPRPASELVVEDVGV